MVGGGTMATYLKRQKMHKAKLGIIEINYALDKLRRELKDLKANFLPTEIKFNTSWEFADYFFDNIFVDMEIRERILESYNATLSLFNSITLLKERVISEKNTNKIYIKKQKTILGSWLSRFDIF